MESTSIVSNRRQSTNLPVNYVATQQQEQPDGQSNQNANVSRSPSQSLLAQLSSSPYGWGSRSTSPTPPPIFSSSLRRVPSGNNRLMPHQSIQSLVKSFINKVSRGTQTDCDDNFDQVSIASLTSGFSTIENNDLARSRLKLFLNDPTSRNNKSTIDESEFIEELQKLRDQIDGRFKYDLSSPQSRNASQPPTPKEYDDGHGFSLDLDRNLEEFGQLAATSDRSTETDRIELEDKETQVDLVVVNSEKSSSYLFPFFSSKPQPKSMFTVASQTEFNVKDLCEDCQHKVEFIDHNKELQNADSIRFIPGPKPVLKCEIAISPSDLIGIGKSQQNIFTFDNVLSTREECKSNASTQVDNVVEGDYTSSGNPFGDVDDDDNKNNNEKSDEEKGQNKKEVEEIIAAKKISGVTMPVNNAGVVKKNLGARLLNANGIVKNSTIDSDSDEKIKLSEEKPDEEKAEKEPILKVEKDRKKIQKKQSQCCSVS